MAEGTDERERTAALAEAHERHLATARPDDRRRQGAFYTPPELVEWVLDHALPEHGAVLDPACGTGHFLVAASRRIGVRAVHGSDLDPEAVRIARERLVAEDPTVPRAEIERQVLVADGLTAWAGRTFDAVIGNPPFLGQLRKQTGGQSEAHRKGLGAYTDTSAIFLRSAVDLVDDGGVVALVQPLSLLAARDAGAVRAAVTARGAITDFWCSATPVFADTGVLTCVPVVRIGATSTLAPDDWGSLAATAFGIPAVELSASTGTVGDLATCTADFRDQFYGLQPFVHDDLPGGVPLITTGLIDPAESRWGRVTTRFARQSYDAPSVDLEALRADGGLSGWARRRMVPKLLVAGQGRVIEAVADPGGAWLPSVPVLSVVPHDPADLWRLLAVTLAPPIVAHAATRYLGTGLSAGSIKVSARQLAQLPLPVDRAAWDEGGGLARQVQESTAMARSELLDRIAKVMSRAYSLPDQHEVVGWWRARVERRSP